LRWITRGVYRIWVGGILATAWPAAAQQANDPSQAISPDESTVQTLDVVHALLPDDEETLDLYRFKNPISVEPNAFSNRWDPPPSPKEISENGGYLVYGLGKLVGLATKGIKGIPGVRGQIQPAVARPPPLDLEQMDRAARISADDSLPSTSAAPEVPPHE
jgi:hypothetical protein